MPVGETNLQRSRVRIIVKRRWNIRNIRICRCFEKSNINIPVLPYRLGEKGHNEMGIIYPKDIFRGTYFSEELKLAIKQRYKNIENLWDIRIHW